MDIEPTSLFDIIAYVETKCNYHGVRFEPAQWERVNQARSPATVEILEVISRIHNCSEGTARMLYCTSFGATQEMGFNIWGVCKSEVDFATFCDDPKEQARVFSAFCSANQILYAPAQLLMPAERLRFALKYNGAATYSNLVLESLEHYGVK